MIIYTIYSNALDVYFITVINVFLVSMAGHNLVTCSDLDLIIAKMLPWHTSYAMVLTLVLRD